jgi:hypothetical protein
MSEYVSRVLLEVNGQEITDFASVEEKEFEGYKAVNLMNKTGHIGVTPRYGVSVDYVIPKETREFDFKTVAAGTLTIDHMNGARTTYTGVYFAKQGATKFDGEKESIRPIEFSCEDRLEE